MGLLLAGGFIVLMLLGMPIGLSIGVASLLVIVASELPLERIPQTMFSGNNSFALVAVPFFILAGDVLSKGGISERIVAFAEAMLGRIRGGLSIVSTIASMFIAAISGSGAATTAAVGAALLPQLKKKGYDIDFSAALIAAAGTIGVVIPPSVPMVLYAVIAGISVAKLFMAGFIPGLHMGGGLIVYAIVIANRRGYPAAGIRSGREKWSLFVEALWGLMTPVIILGGIFSGLFTPSEAAAVAVVYSLFVAFFIYKTITFRQLYELVVGAGVTSALIMFIIATAKVFGWGLAFYQIPEAVAGFLLGLAGGETLVQQFVQGWLLDGTEEGLDLGAPVDFHGGVGAPGGVAHSLEEFFHLIPAPAGTHQFVHGDECHARHGIGAFPGMIPDGASKGAADGPIAAAKEQQTNQDGGRQNECSDFHGLP